MKSSFLPPGRRKTSRSSQKEDRFRCLIENALDVITILDRDGTILFESPSVERVLGYRPEELRGRSLFPLVHPEDAPRAREDFRALVQTPGSSRRFEVRFRHGDGSWRTVESTATNLLDNPSVGGIVCNSRNITLRKEAERALQEQLHLLQVLIDAMPPPVFYKDAQGVYLGCNKAFEAYIGMTKDQIVGKTVYDVAPPHLADIYREADLALFRERGVQIYESRVVYADGTLHDVVFHKATFLNADGTLGGLVGTILDITARKRAEEAVRESEARFRNLMEQAGDAFFVHDRAGRLLDVNQRACDSLGYTREELLALSVPDIEAGVPPSKLLELWSGLAPGRFVTVDGTHRRKDGATFPVEVRVGLFESGGSLLVLAVARDVSERRAMEETLRRSEEQLRQSQKMEAVGRLAGGIAHDFNNLLTAIMGYSELVLLRLSPGDPLRRELEEIRKAGDRAASLTHQLLAFSRRQVLQPKVLDLNAVVANMDRMLRRLIGEDINLVAVLGPGLGQVRADPGQIEQVIVNLAVNSRDAMPKGGRLTIETANVDLNDAYAGRHVSVTPGPYVMLAVSDTGVGMDEEVKSHLFEPFFTTKAHGKGTGLGLSTVYGIVNQSGGHVLVYSDVGRGTTFKIYLPRVMEAVPEPEPKRTAERIEGSETILLVEDETVVRALVCEILRGNGYTVIDVPNGGEALLICERHDGPIHLMLTDVVMPRMSGRELAERLASLRPEMKVLYMSGYTDDAIVHHGVLSLGTEFIQKPFAPDALARKVREVLDGPWRL